MCHVTLLGEGPEGASYKAYRVGVGDLEGGVECLVPYQALGVEMFSIPRNTVIGNHVDCVDDGVFGNCIYRRGGFCNGVFLNGRGDSRIDLRRIFCERQNARCNYRQPKPHTRNIEILLVSAILFKCEKMNLMSVRKNIYLDGEII